MTLRSDELSRRAPPVQVPCAWCVCRAVAVRKQLLPVAVRPASKSDSRGCGRHCRSHRRRPRRASAARSKGRLRHPTGTGAGGEAGAVPRGAVERAEVAATAERDCKRWERARRGVFQARDFQKAISSAICRLPFFFFSFLQFIELFHRN